MWEWLDIPLGGMPIGTWLAMIPCLAVVGVIAWFIGGAPAPIRKD